MVTGSTHGIESAEVVLPGGDLQETLEFFRDRLGFRLDAVFPADAPAVAVVSGHGLRIRFEADVTTSPGSLRLHCPRPLDVCGGERELTAPNGTRITLVEAPTPLVVPGYVPALVVTRGAAGTAWGVGRAGMAYRDLIPGRLGGRYVASHIRVDRDGAVPDHPHFHEVRFQVIYCLRGEVEVVYEDEGPPFVREAGDCVLQPPRIRHRVLSARGGLEVVELACPADHQTLMDHQCTLPTPEGAVAARVLEHPFVRHVSRQAPLVRCGSWSVRDTGIAAATGGLVDVRVLRGLEHEDLVVGADDGELWFAFVVNGRARLAGAGMEPVALGPGDSCAVPCGGGYVVGGESPDLELLLVSTPAAAGHRR